MTKIEKAQKAYMELQLGDKVICQQCQCTLTTIFEKCQERTGNDKCEGFFRLLSVENAFLEACIRRVRR